MTVCVPLIKIYFCYASHWPLDHMIRSRPLIGFPKKPFGVGIQLIICTRRERWCLPYSEFLVKSSTCDIVLNLRQRVSLMIHTCSYVKTCSYGIHLYFWNSIESLKPHLYKRVSVACIQDWCSFFLIFWHRLVKKVQWRCSFTENVHCIGP